MIVRGSKVLNWVFVVIGFIVGGIVVLIGDFLVGSGLLFGVVVGFCVGYVLW